MDRVDKEIGSSTYRTSTFQHLYDNHRDGSPMTQRNFECKGGTSVAWKNRHYFLRLTTSADEE